MKVPDTCDIRLGGVKMNHSDASIITRAKELLQLNRCVIPSGGGDKHKAPIINWTEYQNRLPTEAELNEWTKLKPSLWGMVTGIISGTVVLDADSPEAAELFRQAGLKPHVKTRRGEHYYFKHPGIMIKNQVAILPHVDIRGDGGFVNCLGSNESACYEMLIIPTDDSLYNLTQLPQPVIEKLRKPELTAITNTNLGEIIPDGQQNDWLFRWACGYRTKGDTDAQILEKLKIDVVRCPQTQVAPFTDKNLIDIAGSACKYGTGDSDDPDTGLYLFYDDNDKIKLDFEKLARAIFQEFHFRTYQDTDEMLIYQDGYYQAGGEKFIKAECQLRVGISPVLTEHAINEIIGHVQRSTYVKREIFNQDKVVINLKNGLLNTDTMELRPHSPDFLSTVRIPITYNPEAKATRTMQFMREVHHSEDLAVIQEFFGNCLVPDNSIQKAFLYVGDGENGKSTELNLLKKFIGKANCSSVSWQQLELNRFAMSGLEGKLVNIFADLPSQSMNMTTAFKMLTGGDSIGTEKKFKDGYSFTNYAKLIFSANKPPKVTDEDSYAFWRRWIIIEFPNQFTDDKKDPDLLAKLTTEDELSGLLNWALEGLARLRRNKKYSYYRTVEQTTDYYMRASDPVFAFLQDICEVSDGWEDKDELHALFEQYCKNKKIPSLRPNAFGRAMLNQSVIRVKTFRPEIEENGEKIRVTAWRGIKVRVDEDISETK